MVQVIWGEKIKGRRGYISIPALVSFNWVDYFDDLCSLVLKVAPMNEI